MDYICASRRRFTAFLFILLMIFGVLTLPDSDWVFKCDNGNFVEGEKVRDGIYNDCGDWSDEFDIGNSYWAGNRASDEKRDFEQQYEDFDGNLSIAILLMMVLWYIGIKTIVFGSEERMTLSPSLAEKCECDGRTYSLRATGYTLCIECGKQYPAEEE